MAELINSMDHHALLSDYIKEVGQYLIDHADDLAPKVPLVTDFSINITFPQGAKMIPEIEVSAISVPDPNKIWKIYDMRKANKKESE